MGRGLCVFEMSARGFAYRRRAWTRRPFFVVEAKSEPCLMWDTQGFRAGGSPSQPEWRAEHTVARWNGHTVTHPGSR